MSKRYEHEDQPAPPQGDMPPQGDAEQLLLEAIELVAETRAMPMSSTIKVSKDELLDLL
ncbi:MAG: hypothetical protein ACI8TP_003152, partial [Acidimicrobiales bacterium]